MNAGDISIALEATGAQKFQREVDECAATLKKIELSDAEEVLSRVFVGPLSKAQIMERQEAANVLRLHELEKAAKEAAHAYDSFVGPATLMDTMNRRTEALNRQLHALENDATKAHGASSAGARTHVGALGRVSDAFKAISRDVDVFAGKAGAEFGKATSDVLSMVEAFGAGKLLGAVALVTTAVGALVTGFESLRAAEEEAAKEAKKFAEEHKKAIQDTIEDTLEANKLITDDNIARKNIELNARREEIEEQRKLLKRLEGYRDDPESTRDEKRQAMKRLHEETMNLAEMESAFRAVRVQRDKDLAIQARREEFEAKMDLLKEETRLQEEAARKADALRDKELEKEKKIIDQRIRLHWELKKRERRGGMGDDEFADYAARVKNEQKAIDDAPLQMSLMMWMNQAEKDKKKTKPKDDKLVEEVLAAASAKVLGMDLTNLSTGVQAATAIFDLIVNQAKGIFDNLVGAWRKFADTLREAVDATAGVIARAFFTDERANAALSAGGTAMGSVAAIGPAALAAAGATAVALSYVTAPLYAMAVVVVELVPPLALLIGATIGAAASLVLLTGVAAGAAAGLAIGLFQLSLSTKSYKRVQDELGSAVGHIITGLEPFWHALIPAAHNVALLAKGMAPLVSVVAQNNTMGRYLFDVTKSLAYWFLELQISVATFSNWLLDTLEAMAPGTQFTETRANVDEMRNAQGELARTTFQVEDLGDTASETAKALRQVGDSTFNVPDYLKVAGLRFGAQDAYGGAGGGGLHPGVYPDASTPQFSGVQGANININVYTNDPDAAAEAVVARLEQKNYVRSGRPTAMAAGPATWIQRG